MFKPDGPYARVINAIADLILLSLIWFLLSMTIIGIGPATVALYYTVVKSIRRDRGAPYREFFGCIRENWKISIIMGLLFTVLGASLWMYDLPKIRSLFLEQSAFSAGSIAVSVIKTVLICSVAIYVFPLVSRYQVTVFGALQTAMTLVFRHFRYTFVMLALFVASAMVVEHAPYIQLILPGIIALLLSFFLEPVLSSILSEEDRKNPNGDDQWYLETELPSSHKKEM